METCDITRCTLMQALMHLLLDLGELGATLFILWRCLHAYQPLALGWFRARLRPLRNWLCPSLLACAFFPLVDLAAARSQVRHLQIPNHAPTQRMRDSCCAELYFVKWGGKAASPRQLCEVNWLLGN